MKYSNDMINSITLYILEKIEQGRGNVARATADAFDMSLNTAHKYVGLLLKDGIINKSKRDSYALAQKKYEYKFTRGDRAFESDTYAYDICVENKISSLGENIKHIWTYAISEMVNNVIEHSNADNMYVTVLQDYLKTSVIVTDDGVGIFNKIKSHFNLPSLDEAICELFKGKLTTDDSNHSGEGIFFTSKMMDSFWIRSDEKIFAVSKFEPDILSDIGGTKSGTQVFMSLSNFSKKSAKEIFDAYSDTDGSFNTTRVPLKNAFDSAPISRSQAKRLCNRLESFEEVILDFSDIEWIGQGFAHQLFVVFAKAHPSVILKPINMSDGVLKMYNHVTKTV
ncbi:MAG: DUF4325 domain-containing protein [Clostridia bacterium]|nr:DUF4325 domain-containing protein [Clostridia bacterium]